MAYYLAKIKAKAAQKSLDLKLVIYLYTVKPLNTVPLGGKENWHGIGGGARYSGAVIGGFTVHRY